MSEDQRIQRIKIDEYCPSRTGQPHMGRVTASNGIEYLFEVKFNQPYNVATQMFEPSDYSRTNPVSGAPIVGKAIGKNPCLCRQIEKHYMAMMGVAISNKKREEKAAASSASQPQSSLEPCLAQ